MNTRWSFSALPFLLVLPLMGCPSTGIVPVPSLHILQALPANAVIEANTTVQLGGQLIDAGTATNVTDVSTTAWTTSDATVATVNTNPALGPIGLVSGVSVGTATITVTANGLSGTSAITVQAPAAYLDIYPLSSVMAVGTVQTISAVIVATDNTVRPLDGSITWGTSNPAILSTDQSGDLTANAAGVATVTLTRNGVTQSATVTVYDYALETVSVSGIGLPLTIPVANGPQATGFDILGNFTGPSGATMVQDVTNLYSFSFADPNIASFSGPILTAIGLDPVGSTLDQQGPVSISPSVTIPNNIAAATSPTASLATAANAQTISVTTAPLVGLDVQAPATTFSVAGPTFQLTVYGTFGVAADFAKLPDPTDLADPNDGSFVNPEPNVDVLFPIVPALGGAYNVTPDAAGASIIQIANSPNGQVLTPLAAGTVTLTVDMGTTVTASTTLTFVSSALSSIAIGGVPAPVDVAGDNFTVSAYVAAELADAATPSFGGPGLTATGLFGSSVTESLTSNVTWESDTPSVLSVSNVPGNNGALTPLSAGTATITAYYPGTNITATTGVLTVGP